MIFEDKILNIYKSKMFVRYDKTNTTFCFTADDFEGLNSEAFSFKTKRGDTLKGFFYSYPDYIKGRLVVFDHGMGGGHLNYMKEIEKIARKGYRVFSYDHTGCMESEGESVKGFATSVSDLDSALNALKSDERFKDERISVIGHSWGALACQNIAKFHPDIERMIAISGPISVKSMLEQSFSGLLSIYRKKVYETEKAFNPEYVDCNAIDALTNYNGKALIINSADDKIVNPEYHFNVLKKALSDKENVSFLLVNGKAHNPNYTEDAVKYLGEYFSELTKKTKSGGLNDAEKAKEFVDSFDWHRMTAQDDSVWNIIFETLS